MSLLKHLEAAQAEAANDPRLWIKNELSGLIRRVRVNGGDVKSSSAAAAMQSRKGGRSVPLQYPSHEADHTLINPKKKVRDVANQQLDTLNKMASEGVFIELQMMSDEEIKRHFGKATKLKAFIKDNGGTVNARASWEQSISVLNDLVGRVVISNDEEE